MQFINIAQAGPMSDAKPISYFATNITNFVISVVAVVAILMIVVSGLMYITSAGDESKVANAKKSLTTGIVGLVIALVAFVIVKTISNFA